MTNVVRKALPIVVIAAVFAGIGYIGRQMHESHIDRVASAIELFRSYCLPLTQGEIVEPGGSLERLPSVDEELWAESKSKLTVSLKDGRCSISDQLVRLEMSQRAALREAVVSLVADDLPMLEPDYRHGLNGWDEVLLWAKHPVRDPKRWAIMLSRAADEGEMSATVITLYVPHSGSPAEW